MNLRTGKVKETELECPRGSVKSSLPAVGGSIVPETCAVPESGGRLKTAWLDSHNRNPLGATVPVQKFDFGCCDPLFGGEIAL
jgi:hypothetical protein